MNYIKGTLHILSDLEYFYHDRAFYVPNGTALTASEIESDIGSAIQEFSEFTMNLTSFSYFDLTYNTCESVRGLYEAVIYPADYGELKHIYCIYNDTSLHIDLITE